MMPGAVPPSWRLPEGVNASLWQYAHTARLALEEDEYFADHPLFRADTRALDTHFTEPGRLVDLGCGSGRVSLRFARRGFEVVAVDLSHAMLAVVGAKAAREGLPLGLVEGNLCRLGLADQSFDYAVSMFSTLGMIRGRDARQRALAETHRILRPGGRLALHAHNIFLNLRNPNGRVWLLGHWLRSLFGRSTLGDRRMTYRGIPGMEVHLYTWRELHGELTGAGFVIDEVLAIDAVHALPIPMPWLWPAVRAGGWIVFARRAT